MHVCVWRESMKCVCGRVWAVCDLLVNTHTLCLSFGSFASFSFFFLLQLAVIVLEERLTARAASVAASPTTNMNIAIVKIGSRTGRESANSRHHYICISGQIQNSLVQTSPSSLPATAMCCGFLQHEWRQMSNCEKFFLKPSILSQFTISSSAYY